MEGELVNNSRIAKNTLFLYFRMILLLAVSLYTSRVVMATLGIEDYGVYNVVGGFIGLFAFLNGAMSTSTQRYITVALGQNDLERLNNVFSSCVFTHLIIALIVFILAETIGLWFVREKLVIPESRFVAAMVVYQCSILSTIIVIMSYPYNADIIAHEKMSAFAYISIYEAFASLGIVFLLKLGHIDRLIFYAILLLIVKSSVIIIYRVYCKKYFSESSVTWFFDKKLIKELLSFTGWNLWGGLAGTLMGQGINILLNIFFGPIVNAARGVAVQVQNAVHMFATNFQMAINPQIMKSYSVGDLKSMHSLLFRSAKFSFILLLCLILPIVLEIDFILDAWLKEVPKYSNIFVCLMLYIVLVDSVSNPFMTAAAATGRVKVYQTIVGSLLLLIVPVAYIALKLGGQPQTVFVVHLIIGIIAFIVRFIIIKRLINLSTKEYAYKVIFPCLVIGLIALPLSFIVKKTLPQTTWGSLGVIAISATIVLIISFIFGLTRGERAFIYNKLRLFVAQKRLNDSNYR